MIKQIKRILAVTVILAVIAGALSGCGTSSNGHITVNGNRIDVDYALKFDDHVISMAEYRYYFLTLKTNYFDNGDSTYWSTYPENETVLLDYTLNYLKSQYSALAVAESYGITLTESDRLNIANQITSTMESVGGEDAYNNALAEQYMSPSMYNLLLEQAMIQQKLNNYLFGEGGEMYIAESEEADIIRKNFVHFLHIQTDNEASAAEALGKINAGEDFLAVMSEYNQDTSETEDGYVWTHGQISDVNFENAIFSLGEGQLSGVIQSDYGYHIVRRLEMTDAFISENQDELIETYKSQLLYDILEKKASEMVVTESRYYDQFGVATILNDELDTVDSSSSGLAAVFAVFSVGAIIGYSIVMGLIAILSIVSMWLIFKKAGEKGWAAIIPFYNMYCLFRITWGNGWYFLLCFVPFANFVIMIMTLYKLSKAFGHGTGFFFGLLFLSPIFMPILAFGKSRYLGIGGAAEAADFAADASAEAPTDNSPILGNVDEVKDKSDDYGVYNPDESPIDESAEAIVLPDAVEDETDDISDDSEK